ncbi:hypothetical protein [Alteromonas sp. CYL-A6]|uniref:hypothetical protein n=1 Tax=Alteromonas nitratireducens TaxID=3390813 RepID=UPI0034B84BAD
MQRLFGLLLAGLFSLAVQASPCAYSPAFKALAFDDNGLLISVLRVNGRPVNDAFDVYDIEGHLLVPVSLLAGSLGVAWESKPEEATFYSTSEDDQICQFSIRLTAGDNGQYAWAVDAFDVYIDIQLVAVLLDADVEYDANLLQLSVDSQALGYPPASQAVHIPNFSSGTIDEPDRHVPDEYRWATSPLVNYRLTGLVGDDNEERINANLNASFDLLGHATQYRVATNGDETQQYLNFSRYIPMAEQSWLNQGISYAIGDVQLQRDELVNPTRQSLGAVFYSGNDLPRSSFSSTTIDAAVLPGWRVQLFRNGQFIEERFTESDNRIVFENVETFYGENFFELKLYGPEGQQETQTRTVTVGRDQIAPGKFDFLIAMTDNAQRLLDGDISEQRDQSATARAAFGISESTSLFGSVQQLWGEESTRSYLTMGMHTQISGSLLRVEVSDQQSAGYGAFLGWTGRLGGDTRFNATARFFEDFSSDVYAEELGLEQELSLRLNGRLDWLGYMGWGLTAMHRGFESRDDQSSLALTMNRNLLGGTFSGGLTYTDGMSDALGARLYYAKELGDWQLSSSFQFTPSDNMRMDDAYVSLRWPQTITQFRETRLQYNPNQPGSVELRHQHNWRLEPVNLSLAGAVSNDGDWSVNLSLTGDFSYNTVQGQLDFYRSTGGRAARIDAMAFLDVNRNQIFDGPDQGLPGVGVSGNALWRNARTNENGQLALIANRSNQFVGIDPATLPDPFMQPADSVVEVQTHPGTTTSVYLPVITFNDIDGAVYLVKGDASRGAAQVTLHLMDGDTIIDTTQTETDGYFYFSRVPPGQYRLVIDDGYLESRQLTVVNLPDSIVAPENGNAIGIPDIRLVPVSASRSLSVADAADTEETQQAVARTQGPSRYQIQVGIFRLPRSIYEVLQYLPVLPSELTMYRHHERALTYVTIGSYSTVEAALETLNILTRVPAYRGAFVRPSSHFEGPQWTRESVFMDIKSTVSASNEYVLSVPSTTRFCQLASYRALTSVNPAILRKHPDLMMVLQSAGNTSFFTLLAPLETGSTACEDHYLDHEYRQSPFIVAAGILQPRLIDIDGLGEATENSPLSYKKNDTSDLLQAAAILTDRHIPVMRHRPRLH